jgi:hypothetical protein
VPQQGLLQILLLVQESHIHLLLQVQARRGVIHLLHLHLEVLALFQDHHLQEVVVQEGINENNSQ